MPVQFRYIALTMLLSFGVSSAYLWWRQAPAIKVEPTVPLPAALLQRPIPALSAMPLVEVVAQPQAAVPTPQPQAAPLPPPPNDDGPPLPVLFNVASQAVPASQPDADGPPVDLPTSVNVGNILNTSDRLLRITVIDFSTSNRKTALASVLLTPGGRQNFGPDSGLNLESGDQITLRSDGFHDLTQTVP